jgi:hypothetical protein
MNRYKSTLRGNKNANCVKVGQSIAKHNPATRPTGYRTCSNCVIFGRCTLLSIVGVTEEMMKNCCPDFKPIKEKK